METQFCRSEMLLGEEKMKSIFGAHVAVFGLGGVGSYVVEALARVGIGKLTLVDDDVVAESNINRQLFALHSTVSMPKTDVAAARVADINPNCVVTPCNVRFDASTESLFDFASFDFVVDAIDTVTSKILLVEQCQKAQTPIISCMGTGNKLRADLLRVADISQTSVCPLARVMRRELRVRGIEHLRVVFSTEQPIVPSSGEPQRKPVPGSVSFVPAAAGLLIAEEVVSAITMSEERN